MAKDPESIERDIERSRAELAEMIDGIADRVSPRRVANRGKSRAMAAVASLRSRASALTSPAVSGSGRPGVGAGSTGRPTARNVASTDRIGDLASRGGELLSSGRATAGQLVRRKDPAALAAAVTAVTLLALVFRRRRR